MNKLIEYGIYLLLAMSIFTLGYVEYLTFFEDTPPVIFQEEQISVRVVGDTLITTATVCRYTDVPVTIYASYVDGVVYSLPPEEFSGKEQGCSISSKAYDIPKSIPDGRYYLKGRNEYKVNPLATRIVEWRTVEFEIDRIKNEVN